MHSPCRPKHFMLQTNDETSLIHTPEITIHIMISNQLLRLLVTLRMFKKTQCNIHDKEIVLRKSVRSMTLLRMRRNQFFGKTAAECLTRW